MQHWRLASATLAAAVWLWTVCCVSAQEAPRPPPSSAEIEFWQSVKDSKNPAEVRAYLDKHPNGEFATLARLRLLALESGPKQEQPANAQAPKPTVRPPVDLSVYKALADALAPVEMTPAVVREVQQKLYDLNYSISKIDGVMSDETVVAIRMLQVDMVQSATGKLTRAQLTTLRRAKVATVWGALAWIGQQSSVAFQLPDRAAAERDAKAQCKKKTGKECKVAAVSTSGCAALAASEGRIANMMYWATVVGRGANLEKARESALLECRGMSKTPNLCRVRQDVCADGSHKPQPAVAAASPSQEAKPVAGPAKAAAKEPAPAAGSAPEQRTRPDALAYSATVWPPGSILTNQEVSTKTKYGVLTCRGGWGGRTNQILGRVCSWQ
jgi:peptidoglycan hydrolase-like protein with peptidoglycan-binding domain